MSLLVSWCQLTGLIHSKLDEVPTPWLSSWLWAFQPGQIGCCRTRSHLLGTLQTTVNRHKQCFTNISKKCGYGSIPINTIFSGMNIHKSQLFWCELQGYKVLTHCHIVKTCKNMFYTCILSNTLESLHCNCDQDPKTLRDPLASSCSAMRRSRSKTPLTKFLRLFDALESRKCEKSMAKIRPGQTTKYGQVAGFSISFNSLSWYITYVWLDVQSSSPQGSFRL